MNSLNASSWNGDDKLLGTLSLVIVLIITKTKLSDSSSITHCVLESKVYDKTFGEKC